MKAAASVRDRTCSFIKMLLTWLLTVNRLSSSALAISALSAPFSQQLGDIGLAWCQRLERRRGTIRTERQDLSHLGRRCPDRWQHFARLRPGSRRRPISRDNHWRRPGHLANPLPFGVAAQRQQADPGCSARRRRMTSTPPIPGITRSTTTTSGSRRRLRGWRPRRSTPPRRPRDVESRETGGDALAEQVVVVDDHDPNTSGGAHTPATDSRSRCHDRAMR